MIDLQLIKTIPAVPFLVSAPPQDNPPPSPLQVSARDFGYVIDEQELAEALEGPLPSSSPSLNPPQVEADDFESLYSWFLT
jgi:hypothetical protein